MNGFQELKTQKRVQNVRGTLNMTKTIPLSRGKTAFVDDEDYENLIRYRWYAKPSNRNWYAVTYNNKSKKQINMENFIIDNPNGLIIDHINRNGLDNQRKNLRLATKTQNLRNSRKRRNTSSKYKGVSLYKRYNKWEANIRVNKKLLHLGFFDDEKEAAMAYNEAAKKHFGDFANLNII